MKRKQEDIDENIRKALLALPWPLVAKNGSKVRIRDVTDRQAGADHIAAKRHHLKVDDVKRIPQTLKDPKHCHIDLHNKHYRIYYGVRKGNKNPPWMKIVTEIDRHDSKIEWIVTIYPSKKVK